MYRWVVFIHVLAALTFFLSHGASAAVAFKIGSERSSERLKALLDLSGITINVMFLSLLVLLIAGIVAGFMGKWWGELWIWLSILLLIGIFVWMSIYSRRNYNPLRKALGLSYMAGISGGTRGPEEPQSEEAVLAIAAKIDPKSVAITGYLIPAFILWLMMFKPF